MSTEKVTTEPPITADPQGRELAVSEQPVDRRSMDPQKVRQLIGGQQFVMCNFWSFHSQVGFTFGLESYCSSGPLVVRSYQKGGPW